MLCLCAWLFAPLAQASEAVTIFAAASTKPALDRIAAALNKTGIELRLVYAGSSTLARQIEHGAPADIFISANLRWMDHLAQRGLIDENARRIVAQNTLVLIAPIDSPLPDQTTVTPDTPLSAWLKNERLALADPDHVPAGHYAQEALQALRQWKALSANLARSASVTGALLHVARRQSPLGIVYASDAKRSDQVRVVARFPADSHSPILYPAGVVRGRNNAAAQTVMNSLSGTQGQRAFAAAGFGPGQ